MAVRKSRARNRYYIEFESRGHRVFRWVPAGATKAQGEEYELKLRRELIDQAVLGKAPTVKLDWAIGEWFENVVKGRKDEKAAKSKVALVKPLCIGLHLTRGGVSEAARKILAMQRLDRYGKPAKDKPLTVATLNRRMSILKGTCKWAWKRQHWTAENLSPYAGMLDKKLEKVGRRHIDQAQVEKLIAKAPNFEAKAYIALGCYGLMRSGEIIKTLPEHIGDGLHLPDSKNGEPRVIPVIPALKPFLKAIPFKHHPRTLYEWFLEAREAAGIPNLVHRDLRRSGATILLNAGIPLELVAHVLGDTLEVARKHYAHVLNRTAEKAMRKGFKPIKNPSGKRRLGVTA